jgi:hypothetical protein
MKETVGPVSTCGRELIRSWWRPIGLMVSFMIFTASVRNILVTPSYYQNTHTLVKTTSYYKPTLTHHKTHTYTNIQGVTGVTDHTSGGCSLC